MYRPKPIEVHAEQFTGDVKAITLVELEALHANNIYAFFDENLEELVTVLPYDWIIVKFKGTENEIIEVMSDLDFQRQFEDQGVATN